MRLSVAYKKGEPGHAWQLLHDMIYKYQFAVAVVVPVADLLEQFVWEYLATIAQNDYDSCAIFADKARARSVGQAEFYAGLGRLLAGEDFFVGGVRAKKFTLLSEEDETLLASRFFKFAWGRNFAVVNSSRPHLWDYLSFRVPMTLVYFIGPSLRDLYFHQGFILLRFEPADEYSVFRPSLC